MNFIIKLNIKKKKKIYKGRPYMFEKTLYEKKKSESCSQIRVNWSKENFFRTRFEINAIVDFQNQQQHS